jgi:hypothetical protein
MNDENYIDIPKSMRSRHIYRIISVQRLFELFDNRQNVLVKPKKWEDPFENFVLRSRIRLQNGQMARFGFHDQFYGQCWTLHTASDAMWRIYSKDGPAVRIRSTIRTVAESFSEALGDFAQIQAYIGKVRYLSNKRLIAYANGWFPGARKLTSKHSAQTLLVKRPAFKHEREVRLLYFQHNAQLTTGDLYWYSVDPHEFLQQIMIDPRISETAARELKEKIRKRTGYRGRILRSLLYALPPESFVHSGEAPTHLL